jgi:hypothetical protein
MSSTNPELELAEAFLRDTDRTIFLTGRAGTGKTTFLHNLKRKSPKRMVVTAPTGVAAINAGGVTLHSFFQLPFGPLVPGAEPAERRYRFSRQKRDIVRSLDLLVIDEISMVRADQLDAVDEALRRLRRREAPFGGIQVLMIGDLHQLSPVIRDNEWRLLQPHYRSPYFFSSRVLERLEMVPIELQKVYRQSDDDFIRLLNQVRDGHLDGDGMARLKARLRTDTASTDLEGYITLCTHNRRADAINADRLAALPGDARRFEADVSGDFPPHAYPTFGTLGLKVGAQVMFVRNDPSPDKRFYNGKLGEVARFSGDFIEVRCPDDEEVITVAPSTWENVQYHIDPETAAITAEVTGTFRQYPLKPAWAITIHKSQGLTFNKAIVDAEAAFAYGQVYVALSRCRTLEGLVLSTPLPASGFKPDDEVQQFLAACREEAPTREQAEDAARVYQQKLLLACFDFRELGGLLGRLQGVVGRYEEVLQIFGADGGAISACGQKVRAEICRVGDKFQHQLQCLFPETGPPGEDPAVRERLSKAAAYFEEKFATLLRPLLENLVIETDNKEVRRRLKLTLDGLRTAVAEKSAAVAACGDGFTPEAYSRALATARLAVQEPPKAPQAPTYSEADVGHPELFEALKTWRAAKAAEEGVPHFRVLHQKTLIQITVHLPDTIGALKAVKGIGDKLAERYGEELVALVAAYRQKHDIEAVILPDPRPTKSRSTPKKAATPKVDTKQLSLELFEKGLNISQIAAQRCLAASTIEGHLAHWVAQGRLTIDRVVAEDARNAIEQGVTHWDGVSYKVLKDSLDRTVSYGEIKLVLAYLKYREGRGS